MKNKILIFVVGLFAGVTLGVLFSVAIKELLIQFKELHISLNNINLKQSQLSQRLDSIQGKWVLDNKGSHQLTAPQNLRDRQPVTQLPQTPKGALNDTTDNPANIAGQTSKPTAHSEDSDIVVMTNQLVSVLSVPLKVRDTVAVNVTASKTDSALASMSDVDQTKEPLQYRIEFWKSPLNYKGYKMSKGKIILYGINPVITMNLFLQDGVYYLIVNQNAFMLEYTDDYKPFEKVTEKLTLKKLGL